MSEVAAFVEECCEVGPELYELTAANAPLFQTYLKWCEQANAKSLNHMQFTGELTNLGYERGQKWMDGGNKKVRFGLALRKEWARLTGR
jgi:phage/plasmid-associated DNA primase